MRYFICYKVGVHEPIAINGVIAPISRVISPSYIPIYFRPSILARGCHVTPFITIGSYTPTPTPTL